MSAFSKDASEGLASAAISWGENKIKALAKRLLDHKLIFIQDDETINLVKQQLKSGEWDLCKKYIKDKRLKILVQLGLTLRRLEEKGDRTALENLRDKICDSPDHGTEGLHIAQFVQNKLLKEHIISIVGDSKNVVDLIRSIEDFLNNLETRVTFIQKEHKITTLMSEINTRIYANSPESYLVFARDSALDLGFKIKTELEKKIKGYQLDVKESGKNLILILTKQGSPLDQL